jgi:hypothetical protein
LRTAPPKRICGDNGFGGFVDINGGEAVGTSDEALKGGRGVFFNGGGVNEPRPRGLTSVAEGFDALIDPGDLIAASGLIKAGSTSTEAIPSSRDFLPVISTIIRFLSRHFYYYQIVCPSLLLLSDCLPVISTISDYLPVTSTIIRLFARHF